MSKGAAVRCKLLLASSIMQRAGNRDGVGQRGEAQQCAIDWGNQLFSGSEIVWLARFVRAS